MKDQLLSLDGASVWLVPGSAFRLNLFHFARSWWDRSLWPPEPHQFHISKQNELTSMIILPRVLFRSLWLALFSSCWSTLSLVVRYSRANSAITLRNSEGLVLLRSPGGTPRYRRNLLYLQQANHLACIYGAHIYFFSSLRHWPGV